MVVSPSSTGINGNFTGENEVYKKKEVNVIQYPDGTVSLAVSDVGTAGAKPQDPAHQNYRRISINLSVTNGTPIQISNVAGKSGGSIDSIAPNGYTISELFVMADGVPGYDTAIIIYRGGTANTNIITEMNYNEGATELKGGEKNNSLTTNATYLKFIGFSGSVNIVVGFWY